MGFGWVFEIQSFCAGSIGGYKECGSVFFNNFFLAFSPQLKKINKSNLLIFNFGKDKYQLSN